MAARHTHRQERDGVTVTRTGNVRTGIWLLLLALGLIAVMLVFVVRPFLTATPSVAAPGQRARAAKSGASAGAERPRSDSPRPSDRRDRSAPQLPAAGARKDASGLPATVGAEEPAGDSEGEEPSGIALFPPPGTDPVKAGIVVPEDFELPPGYVRHYQTTDDGKQLPAILMFHPDYQPVDADGVAIALPEDRVVPPAMAPPGLTPEMLDVPDDPVPLLEGPNDRPDAH